MSTPARPVETKVLTAVAGTFSGGVLSTFLIWILAVEFFHASTTASEAQNALASVPAPVSGLVVAVVTLGLTFLGGYWAPHTLRPDLETPPDAQVLNQPELPVQDPHWFVPHVGGAPAAADPAVAPAAIPAAAPAAAHTGL